MTRYIEAFTWTTTIDRFVREIITERPLLNVCSGRELFGDINVDLYEPSDVKADWLKLPFKADTFAAVFADPPWNGGYKKASADFVKEALRIAPIVYVMSPWIYGSKSASLTRVWVRQLPGVNNAIVIARYERTKEVPRARCDSDRRYSRRISSELREAER